MNLSLSPPLSAGGTFVDGVYTAKEDGVFILSSTQRVDGMTGSFVRLLININSQGNQQNGLHSFAGKV